MSDYRAIVRDEIARLGLSADRERKVVEELSQQIAEIHESFVARGFTDDAAREATLRQVPPWPELLNELLEAEPLLRTIHPDHAPFAGPAKKALASDSLASSSSSRSSSYDSVCGVCGRAARSRRRPC